MIIFQLIAILLLEIVGFPMSVLIWSHCPNFASRHEAKLKLFPDHLMWKYLSANKSSVIATMYYFFVPDCLMAAIMLNVSTA